MPQERTVTKDKISIGARGDDRMEFYKLDQTPKPGYQIRAIVGPGSVLDVPPHFHLKNDEQFCVEKGEVQITINGVKKTYDSSSGDILIKAGEIHAVYAKAPPDSEVICWEKAMPSDGEKELMLRVMNSVMLDSPSFSKTGNLQFTDILQINLTFYEHDAYMAPLPHWLGPVGRSLSMAIDGTLAFVARRAGYKSWYKEYVTDDLVDSVHKKET